MVSAGARKAVRGVEGVCVGLMFSWAESRHHGPADEGSALGHSDLGESVKGKLPIAFSISSMHIYSASETRRLNLES